MTSEATVTVLDLNLCGTIQEQIIRRSDLCRTVRKLARVAHESFAYRYCVFPWMPTRMQYLLVKIERL